MPPSPRQTLTLKTTLCCGSSLRQWAPPPSRVPSPRSWEYKPGHICSHRSVTPTPFPSVRPFEIGNTSTCFESQHKSQATRGETFRRHRCRWPFRAIPSRFFQGYLRTCKSRDTRTCYVPSDVKMRRDDTKPFVMPREHFTVPETS